MAPYLHFCIDYLWKLLKSQVKCYFVSLMWFYIFELFNVFDKYNVFQCIEFDKWIINKHFHYRISNNKDNFMSFSHLV